ncbi:MAG TPA: TonB-dependent receptor, partial [Sphingomonadaceae bacterium]|nr:TonB-dependent receptor [Sphingomonadaceae bacterium]
QIDWRPIDLVGITVGGRYTRERKRFEGFQSDANGGSYKQYGFDPIEANRIPLCDLTTALADAGTPGVSPVCFPNPGQPLRYYIAGQQHKRFSNFSPKVGLQLHPTEDIMAYGSWSKGYKTGGWTTRLSNPLPYAPDFDEEKATTWEIGIKSTLLDRRLQINAAAFSTKYRGIQLNFQQGVSPVVQNAGNARIKGFEVEVVAAPTPELTVNGSIGYVDSYYTSVDPAAQVPASPDQIGVFPGATLPKTPKWKFNISPRFELPMADGGSLVFLADYTHTTKLKNDTEGTYLLNRGATDNLNASVTYRLANGHWEITAGGTNITNKRYLVTGQYQAAGGEIYGTYNRPIEWYARLGLKF